ncbi:MAG: hypothetical protein V7K88_25930 [Nostoc sp.]|uniref:hypothetical protein n=1 Tax=Nostoc sp. TaxID=1180 RepID=UPI002FFA56DD
MSPDPFEKLIPEKQQRDSVATLKNSGVNASDDKSYFRSFATPGFSQVQVMVKVGKCQLDASAIKAIADGVLARLYPFFLQQARYR